MAGTLFGKPKDEVIKHPGAVKRAAARHGKSVTEEARSESKSSDKHIAARGRLALRFKGQAKKGNFRKAKGARKAYRRKVAY